MSQTVNLKLPLLDAGQAQKHVTLNEALARIDAAVQARVLDRDLTAPPGAPVEGDAYIVADDATGVWAGHDREIAYRTNGAWAFLSAEDGWTIFVADEAQFLTREGGTWRPLFSQIARLGVNAAADGDDRLTVRSSAVLLTAVAAADGGTGDMRVKLNKEGPGDSASHLFQTGYAGRAEIGLTGDDDFHLKVSADGSAWTEALVVDRSTGAVRLPGAVFSSDGLAQKLAGGGTINSIVQGEGNVQLSLERYSANNTQPGLRLRKARGTIAAPANVLQNDIAGILAFQAYGGGDFRTAAGIRAIVAEASPGGSAMGSRLEFTVAPTGSITPVEVARLEPASGLSMFGANKVIDENRNLHLRAYAVAGLPSAAVAGVMIYVSDESGGATPAFSDGAAWRRVTDRLIVS